MAGMENVKKGFSNRIVMHVVRVVHSFGDLFQVDHASYSSHCQRTDKHDIGDFHSHCDVSN